MDSEMEDSESLLATIAEETAEEMSEDQQVIDSNEQVIETSEDNIESNEQEIDSKEHEIETNEEKIDSKEDAIDDEPPTSKNFLAESSLKLTQIPLARIKHIMKMDSDVNMASQVG
jgi:hypothetical protein